MDFSPNDTQSLVQQTARDYAQKTILPQAAAIDRDERFPADLLKGLADLGLMAVNVPAALGGAEAGVVAYSLAMTEIARTCASTAVTMAVTNMVGEVIARFGTKAQAERHCPKLADGTYAAGAFALSEPGAGSDAGAMRTTARKIDGGWVIDGQKMWITSGAHAGVMVVWARTGGPGTGGISCFLVEKGQKGLIIGHHEDKMGLRGSNTVSLTFDGCEVPDDALLGEVNGGFKIAMMALDGGRIGISSQAIGIATAALDEAIAYAKDRKQFDKPLADFQAIQWMIADSKTELDASRLLCLRAASMKERGVPFSKEASMSKVFSSEAAVRICNRAVQVLGGYGYTREFAAERHLRDVRVTTIYEGTSQVQKIVIARSVLK
ncbi:MAG: acyl-CoA dehydrogenase family protein [Deltaproteobacteria bacterium]|nr:acyl-CoA dehydrogenase family protein [Deltaproteobacteria bacterium]